MASIAAAVVDSALATLIEDGPALDETLLAAQLSDDAPGSVESLSLPSLPSLPAMCAALGVPVQRTPAPAAEHRLPLLIAQGDSTPGERALWRTFDTRAIHEVLTRELVEAVVAHLSRALDRCVRAGVSKPTILEAGAGSGALTRALALELAPRARVVGVDDSSSHIARVPGRPSEPWTVAMDQQQALEHYAPDLVVVSWMPPGRDWTAGFRACRSVREYLLLGAADSSTCGDEWATWRRPVETAVVFVAQLLAADCPGSRRWLRAALHTPESAGCAPSGSGAASEVWAKAPTPTLSTRSWGVLPERGCEYGLDEESLAPHAADGWVRAQIDEIAAVQLCRFDSRAARGYSTAVAFARLATLAQACGAPWPWEVPAGFSGEPACARWAAMRREHAAAGASKVAAAGRSTRGPRAEACVARRHRPLCPGAEGGTPPSLSIYRHVTPAAGPPTRGRGRLNLGRARLDLPGVLCSRRRRVARCSRRCAAT